MNGQGAKAAQKRERNAKDAKGSAKSAAQGQPESHEHPVRYLQGHLSLDHTGGRVRPVVSLLNRMTGRANPSNHAD